MKNDPLEKLNVLLGGKPRPKSKRIRYAVLNGKKTTLTRRSDGSYPGPEGPGAYCSPLAYCLDKWKAAGAEIKTETIPNA